MDRLGGEWAWHLRLTPGCQNWGGGGGRCAYGGRKILRRTIFLCKKWKILVFAWLIWCDKIRFWRAAGENFENWESSDIRILKENSILWCALRAVKSVKFMEIYWNLLEFCWKSMKFIDFYQKSLESFGLSMEFVGILWNLMKFIEI